MLFVISKTVIIYIKCFDTTSKTYKTLNNDHPWNEGRKLGHVDFYFGFYTFYLVFIF